MGIINHNAVIAVTSMSHIAHEMHVWIRQQNPEDCFALSPAQVNDTTSFILWPDGSKEGWQESDDGDDLRSKFIRRIAEDDYSDGSSPWAWVEVGFGEYGQEVLAGNCKNQFSGAAYEPNSDSI
ncbi:MAG: hypothetical protein O7D91_21460 [Planctomycetota bacterium]|nr:hypothetical protein [Planctomycetota bacterium]